MSPSNNTNPVEGAAQLAATTTASGDHGAATATTTASSTNTTGVGDSPPPLPRATAALTTPSPSQPSPTNSNVVDSSPLGPTTDETPNGNGNEDDTTKDIFDGLNEQRRREWDLVKLTKIVPKKSKGTPSAVYNYMYMATIDQDKVRQFNDDMY